MALINCFKSKILFSPREFEEIPSMNDKETSSNLTAQIIIGDSFYPLSRLTFNAEARQQ